MAVQLEIWYFKHIGEKKANLKTFAMKILAFDDLISIAVQELPRRGRWKSAKTTVQLLDRNEHS